MENKLRMQLHLATDNKFIDYFIRRQRQFFPEKKCRYVIISDESQLRYVRSGDVEICSSNKDSIIKLFDKKDLQSIYIHFLMPIFYEPILNIPKHLKLYWIFWGAEAFSRPKIYPQFLDKYSSEFYHKHFYEGKKNKLFHRGIMLPSTWEKYKNYKKNYQQCSQAFKRVDYFCHYLIEDYQFLKKTYSLKAEFIDFNYCSINDISGLPKTSGRDDRTILIGNSGSEANNHISLLRLLSKTGICFDQVFCPLSYSGEPEYVQLVIGEGRKCYGNKFIPLLDFMPKKEYDAILDSAGKFFHNHYRSQAYGNVAYQLYNGRQVYMSPKSSLYRYLVSNNLSIGKILKNQIVDPVNMENNPLNIERLLSESKTNEKYKDVLY